MDLLFRTMTEQDWPSVAGIYKQGIETGNATFEKVIPSWDKWNSSHLSKCRIVAVLKDSIVAWAALTPVSNDKCLSPWM